MRTSSATCLIGKQVCTPYSSCSLRPSFELFRRKKNQWMVFLPWEGSSTQIEHFNYRSPIRCSNSSTLVSNCSSIWSCRSPNLSRVYFKICTVFGENIWKLMSWDEILFFMCVFLVKGRYRDIQFNHPNALGVHALRV